MSTGLAGKLAADPGPDVPPELGFGFNPRATRVVPMLPKGRPSPGVEVSAFRGSRQDFPAAQPAVRPALPSPAASTVNAA